MKQTRNGFTLVEMVFCVSVILVILLLVIPNVTSKNNMIKDKSCDAQIEVVNSQIILYQIETGELPTSISQLTSGSKPYLTKKQSTCPNGKKIEISDGQAYAS
ncbi:MAG: prepilin-type N-terminal cleavage/methylation domain-containing protein [Erysipelotrichaceae bacterium]|nr:prepilin-type N-terminal cleavage/methylation domain-containing protein [Erysipelotrichaceae bacterium]